MVSQNSMHNGTQKLTKTSSLIPYMAEKIKCLQVDRVVRCIFSVILVFSAFNCKYIYKRYIYVNSPLYSVLNKCSVFYR
jgi:hypothetical protein